MFEPINNETPPKRGVSPALFFSVNRWNGGFICAALRRKLGNPEFVEVEIDSINRIIRMRSTTDKTKSAVKDGRVRLPIEVRERFCGKRTTLKTNLRYPMRFQEDDGWWYSVL